MEQDIKQIGKVVVTNTNGLNLSYFVEVDGCMKWRDKEEDEAPVHQDLLDCMQDFAPYVSKVLGYEDFGSTIVMSRMTKSEQTAWKKLEEFHEKINIERHNRMIVHQVIVTGDEDDGWSVKISVKQKLICGKTFTFNTPSIDLTQNNYNCEERILECMVSLKAEARAYLMGKRADKTPDESNGTDQLDLVDESENELAVA